MTEIIPVNPVFTQIALKKLAYFGGSTLGNDIYYMKEFIDMMINVIGEEKLIYLLSNDTSENKAINNKIGDNWSLPVGMKNKLMKFDKLIDKTKRSYDVLDTNDLKKVDGEKYKFFLNNSKDISAIKPELYSLFVFIIAHSSIQKLGIRNEDFKVMQQRGYRAAGELNKRKVGDRIEPKDSV